jgi:hypothetical protein
MTVLFRCVDPFGREILLTEEVWYGHIVLGHAEFRERQSIVQAALTAPGFINLDRRHPLREVYYRASSLRDPFADLLVRVVVKFYEAGEVVTAHFIREPHKQERRKWP